MDFFKENKTAIAIGFLLLAGWMWREYNNRQIIDVLQTSHAQEISHLEEIAKERDEKLKAIHADYEKRLSDMQAVHQKEMEVLDQKFSQRKNKIIKDFHEDKDALKEMIKEEYGFEYVE